MDSNISPLLDFDPSRKALIEPADDVRGILPESVTAPEACVLAWFHDATARFVEQFGGSVLVENPWEDGPHPLYEVDFHGRRLAIAAMPVGSVMAGAVLEQYIAYGCRSFIACGGAGRLVPEVTSGHLVVVTSALRDEGTSHHYLAPSRVVEADAGAVAALEKALIRRGVPYVTGRTWTTDGVFRETPAKIAARREEGCLMVEMEASAVAAVAQFRGVPLAQVLYGGDDVSGDEWGDRGWQAQHELRDTLIEVAAEAVLELDARH